MTSSLLGLEEYKQGVAGGKARSSEQEQGIKGKQEPMDMSKSRTRLEKNQENVKERSDKGTNMQKNGRFWKSRDT